jgi:ABC-2 type transport system permease protein
VTTTPLVLTQMISSRRRSTVWWSVGMAVLVVGIASAYPSARDSGEGLESYMDSLPDGVVELFGATAGIGTPVGYLNSQLYANLLPLLLIVMGVGAGSWAVAGAEADGTLEMLLANPVTRTRVAVERLLGLVMLFGLTGFVDQVSALKWVSPWFWFLDADPLAGVTSAFWWEAVALPLAVCLLVCLGGVARLVRRDLH